MAPQSEVSDRFTPDACQPGKLYRTPGGMTVTYLGRIDGKPYVKEETEGQLEIDEHTELVPIEQIDGAIVAVNCDPFTESNAVHNRIIDSTAQIEKSFWDLGMNLRLMRDQKLYIQQGFKSFDAYVKSPEVQISHGKAYALIRIVEEFQSLSNRLDVAVFGLQWSKLMVLLPALREIADPEEIKSLIEQARNLSKQELSGFLKARRVAGAQQPVEAYTEEDELEALRRSLSHLSKWIKLTDFKSPRGYSQRAHISLKFEVKDMNELLSLMDELGTTLRSCISTDIRPTDARTCGD